MVFSIYAKPKIEPLVLRDLNNSHRIMSLNFKLIILLLCKQNKTCSFKYIEKVQQLHISQCFNFLIC